ncbi:uncharacterized protein [Fopius arisanus]|uniref:NPDC1 protein n=1 Tax=Fopius arisanus TaxID=64838 RepID=A0A0C9QLI8_9HYME|nr:PREDICTED: uncharacterized protein LOC105267787 [Fopius arisanus]XP_011305197.1 PREDICTED: uncharacterized protein LOC105267787 [Fopius arisanus]
MKFDPPTFRFLVINLCLLINITTGELEYYQDVDSESSTTNLRLKQIERYLASQSRPRLFRRDHAPPSYRHIQAYEDDIYQERERQILDALVDHPSILKLLEKSREDYLNSLSDYNSIPYSAKSPIRPYLNVNLEPPEIYEYPKIKMAFPEGRISERGKLLFQDSPSYPLRLSLPDPNDSEKEKMKSSLEKLQNQLLTLYTQKYYIPPKKVTPNDVLTEFTYHFGEPKTQELTNSFAAKPNDPRYWEKVDHVTRREEHPTTVSDDDARSEQSPLSNTDANIKSQIESIIYQSGRNFNDVKNEEKENRVIEIIPEPHRRSGKAPIITFTRSNVNNDVYFIAIVAGCSAAAMFALVLISLTWCRLQRNVKAAADIDYPAYGVTGPNKDVSPSGDQRLAHSAQMYHFQHQKQQIIAMEKSAASRDPGSVSEAESDEENEEGDYTVYECPGLAPAGEVEVKNPMFNDDPTPATPPLNNTQDEESRH